MDKEKAEREVQHTQNGESGTARKVRESSRESSRERCDSAHRGGRAAS
jgi:hypothetical protein